MCRDLRVSKNWSQAEMGIRSGLKSYSNVEYNNHKTIRLERVHAIARVHELNEADTARLVAAWEALPVSEYSQKQRQAWDKRNAARAKSRGYDEARRCVIELFGVALMVAFDLNTTLDRWCTCLPGGGSAQSTTRLCEICNALTFLGLPRWTDTDTAVTGIGKLQDELGEPDERTT